MAVEFNQNRRLNGIYSPLSYIGVNPVEPSNIVFYNRAPTVNDLKNFLLGTIWIWQTAVTNPAPPPPLTPAKLWILTAIAQGQATWTQIESPVTPADFSLSGDTGTATGNPISLTAQTTAGSSVTFQAGGTTVTFNPSDTNHNTLIGGTAGSATLAGSNNTALGYAAASNYTTTESSNISIGYNTKGTATESNVLRIGAGTGAGAGQLSKAFISGIDGVNVGSVARVVTEASDQLGTAIITAGTGITVTPGANTITISAGGAVAESFVTDAGTATPAAGVLNVNGLAGGNIHTAGAGNTVTVAVSGTTQHSLLLGNATGSINNLGVATNGQLPIGSAGADPVLATLTAGTGISITNGAGSITVTATGATQEMVITQFTASGTWTKNAVTQYVEVLLWSSGGGGGSGRQGASTAAGGGGGGGGGGFIYYRAPASQFSASETVTIGAGGTGGAAQAANNTNGNNGGDASNSSVGNIITSQGSNFATVGGTGGTTTNASGGSSGNFGGMGSLQAAPGAQGGGGGTNTAGLQGGVSPFKTYFLYGTGAGGGGAGADSGTARQGGASNIISTFDQVTTLVAAAAGGIETGTINGANGNAQFTGHGLMTGGGGGGGGGGQKAGGVAGIGGNGAAPAGGGGGGGGSLNGTNSGAGGNGARGEVWIIEYF